MRELTIGKTTREKTVKALKDIAEAVGSTLGPGGLPAIIDKKGITDEYAATVSKDGLTVLNALQFSEPISHAIHQFARVASSHSVLDSGDGTTSTLVLAAAIAEGIMNEKSNVPQMLARKVQEESEKIISKVKELALKEKGTEKLVALTSSNGDSEIADVVIDALEQTSAFGTVIVDKDPSCPDRYRVEKQEGYYGGRGYNFNNILGLSVSERVGENQPFDMNSPDIMLFNGTIGHIEMITPVINLLSSTTNNNFELLIVAYDFTDQVCNELLVINKKIPGVKVMLCKTRQSAEFNGGLQILLDLGAMTGSNVIDGGNYKSVVVNDLGTCARVEFSPFKTYFFGRSKNHHIPKRVEQNNNAATHARDEMSRELVKARNAELAEGLMTIRIGGGHLANIQERADRVDDALKAAQAAKRDGVVAGCGITYARAAAMSDSSPMMRKAMCSVVNRVFENYGVNLNYFEDTDVDEFRLDKNLTYKLTSSGVEKGNFLDLKVVDSAATVCSVIRNATELGVLCATTGCTSLLSDLTALEAERRFKTLIGQS